MPIVDLALITVPPSRIRKEFPPEKQEELKKSILSKGLMHPLVVDKDLSLLAGERRWRVLSQIAEQGLEHQCNGKVLKPGLVMVTHIRDLSRTERLEAELEENTVRLDVTWDEKAKAVAQLAELRAAQRAEATGTEASSDPMVLRSDPAIVAKVAAEVRERPEGEPPTRWEVDDVRRDLLVAAWLQHEDADVSAAPDRKTALKIIERKLEHLHREALARRFVRREQRSEHTLLHGDCLEILPTLPANHFDVLICDPPYGINADGFANQAAVKHDYSDDANQSARIHHLLASEGFRITKERAHAYIFCDIRRFESYCRVFERAGWYVWPRPLIWYKGPNVGIAPRPEHGPRNTYECIIYCIKGDRRVTRLYPDVLTTPHDRTVERAAHKPAQLYAELLERSCLPGNVVIDPCCGSGPIFDAARDLHLIATGIELDAAAVGLASKRIEGEYIPEGTDTLLGGLLGSLGCGESGEGGGEESEGYDIFAEESDE